MQTIKIKLNKITDKQIDLIVAYLKRGKVVAYPTDTVYGLGCLATNRKAITKVHKIKKQELKKPLLVLISDYKMLEEYCNVNKIQKEYLKKIWPIPHPNLSPPIRRTGLARRGAFRPVTVVLKLKKKMPKELTDGLKTLAVRLPKSKFLIKIIKKLGEPIVSTSLNLVGQPLLNDVSKLDQYFKNEKPDLVIDAGFIKSKPSKLIDIREINNIKILRK